MRDEVKIRRLKTVHLKKFEELKYLGTTLTNQNFIQDEIKSRLNSANAFYNSIKKFVFQFAIQKFKY
jgi:hypothetical protein